MALAEEEVSVFRIGINLGDVIIEDEDIHGDVITVAARLEGLVPPGGICISRAGVERVRLALGTEALCSAFVEDAAHGGRRIAWWVAGPLAAVETADLGVVVRGSRKNGTE